MTPNSFSWASSLKRRGGGRKPGNQDHEDVVGSLNCMEWSLLPPATEEMAVETSVVKGRFMGDPSHEYEHTELQKMKEGEKVFEEEVVVSEDKRRRTKRAQPNRNYGGNSRTPHSSWVAGWATLSGAWLWAGGWEGGSALCSRVMGYVQEGSCIFFFF